MKTVQIDAKLLAEIRDLIYLDGRRALLIVAADSALRAPQADNVPPNQSEEQTDGEA